MQGNSDFEEIFTLYLILKFDSSYFRNVNESLLKCGVAVAPLSKWQLYGEFLD